MTRARTRARVLTASALLALLVIALTSTSIAQRRADGGGRILDANLGVNSGGYNRPVPCGRSPLQTQRYSVGSSRPLYVVGRGGTMHYNRHNAFSPRHRYRATGYTGHYTSRSSLHRFRY